jgi:molecular chaperone DnaK
MAGDNKTLGRFMLDGIPPAPRGVPQIEVAFDVDSNGILNVSAKDKATNKTQSIRIEGSIGMSEQEIEKMKQEAQAHEEEDKKKKELIEARNMADNLIYTWEKTSKDAGDKITEDLKKQVQEKIEELNKVKDKDNLEEIKAKTKELSDIVQQAGAQMYKQNKPKENK